MKRAANIASSDEQPHQPEFGGHLHVLVVEVWEPAHRIPELWVVGLEQAAELGHVAADSGPEDGVGANDLESDDHRRHPLALVGVDPVLDDGIVEFDGGGLDSLAEMV